MTVRRSAFGVVRYAKKDVASTNLDSVFVGPLESLDYGRMVYWVSFLAEGLQKRAPFVAGGRLRMRRTIGGEPCLLAWLREKGRHYLLVSQAFARTLHVLLGNRVKVRFSLVEAARIAFPAEIAEALRQEPA